MPSGKVPALLARLEADVDMMGDRIWSTASSPLLRMLPVTMTDRLDAQGLALLGRCCRGLPWWILPIVYLICWLQLVAPKTVWRGWWFLEKFEYRSRFLPFLLGLVERQPLLEKQRSTAFGLHNANNGSGNIIKLINDRGLIDYTEIDRLWLTLNDLLNL